MAVAAVSELQRRSAERGLDTTTADEIEIEIRAARRDRRQGTAQIDPTLSRPPW